jgi:hypothetical protein
MNYKHLYKYVIYTHTTVFTLYHNSLLKYIPFSFFFFRYTPLKLVYVYTSILSLFFFENFFIHSFLFATHLRWLEFRTRVCISAQNFISWLRIWFWLVEHRCLSNFYFSFFFFLSNSQNIQRNYSWNVMRWEKKSRHINRFIL